jgi:L-threonylcarbamoyladenylate synthase
VNCIEQAVALSRELPEHFVTLAKKFWPGALTLVVDASHLLPLKVTGNTGRVALRWPKSAIACGLIEHAETPITGTSANISSFPSCTNAGQLLKQLGNRIPLVLDSGETGASVASTIVDLHGAEWKILREGTLTLADIEAALLP